MKQVVSHYMMTGGHCSIGLFYCPALIFCMVWQLLLVACSPSPLNFYGELFVPWAPSHMKVLNKGQELQLVLDKTSGSGLASQNKFMYGSMEVQMKVAPGNTAGTVTAFYLSSGAEDRDELDFEFLGNVSGQPYLLQTNIFTNGTGYKEQRIQLWFDPTLDFHTYSISWTKQRVIFSVDGTPIRVFQNQEQWGQLYVDRKPMGAFFSIWNGDDWATEGGLVKINWTAAPWVANYKDFNSQACVFTGNMSDACIQNHSQMAPLASTSMSEMDMSAMLQWVEENFMVYDYCKDRDRFPVPPSECRPLF